MTKDKNLKRTLSIRISTDGFCFCDYIPSQPDSLNYFFYKTDKSRSMAANLKAGIEENPFIEECNEYEIKYIIETNEFTAIPIEFDNKENYKVFYRQCFPNGNTNTEIIANKLNAQGFTIIFPIEKGLYEEICSIGEASIFTPASILAGFASKAPLEGDKYMLAYLHGKYALLLSIKDSKAELINIFSNDNSQNTLFYILSMWKEQELSQVDDTLYICGDKRVEEMIPLIGKFIKNCKRINPNEIFRPNLLNKIEGIPFDLQTLILCE